MYKLIVSSILKIEVNNTILFNIFKGGIFIITHKLSNLSDETVYQMYLSVLRHPHIKGLQELKYMLLDELLKRNKEGFIKNVQ